MELYDTLDDFLRSCPDNGVNFEIQSAFLKAWSKIHGWNNDGKPWTMYPVILTAMNIRNPCDNFHQNEREKRKREREDKKVRR